MKRGYAMMELAAWSIAIAGSALAVSGWRSSSRMAADSAVVPSLLASPAEPRALKGDSLDRSVARIVASDPFRIARRPASVSFATEQIGVPAAPPPPRPPRPQLALAGILGGPPWEALLEGLPDRPSATLVRAGDVFGGLKVRAVMRDTVIVQGADTVWKLTMKRSWQ